MVKAADHSYPAVRVDSFEPRQRATRQSLRIATEFSVQWMLKHPHRSEFHCRSEHLYSGLLEGDSDVISFVPQPFTFQIGRTKYTPDFFVQANARSFVVEIKPNGKVDTALTEPTALYLKRYEIGFEIVSNESIAERAVEAENWLEIVRVLHVNKDLPTEREEQRLLEAFYQQPESTLGGIVTIGDRASSIEREVALFRLLHSGLLTAELSGSPLDFSTEIRLQ